jgi:hypothetical protein
VYFFHIVSPQSAASGILRAGWLIIAAAAAYRFAAGYHAAYDRGRAAHAGSDGKGAELAVERARPAFHAPVFICDPGLSVRHFENRVRAHLGATPATGAFCRIIRKRGYVFQVFHMILHD